MLRKRTEVSRLSRTFPLIHPHGDRMMFTWSDLGHLREYLLIGIKHGMPWRAWPSTISESLENEAASLDKTSK